MKLGFVLNFVGPMIKTGSPMSQRPFVGIFAEMREGCKDILQLKQKGKQDL